MLQEGPGQSLKVPAREGPLTKEEDPQAQQDQGSEETHVEGDAQLPACTLALDLVLHTQGGHGLRSAGPSDKFVPLLTTCFSPGLKSVDFYCLSQVILIIHLNR